MSSIDEASKEEKSQLIQLLRENKAEEAKRLLQKYKNLAYSKDDCGRTAIHWAASGGCLEIVQFCICLRNEDAVSADDMGWTPLMIASSAGRLDVVRYLISLPLVDVNATNTNGQTALHYAASKNHPIILSLLLKNGANVNAQDRYHATPLHRAASQGHQKIVSLLLANPQLRIDVTDSSGCSPLHLAVEEHREDVALALVERGANLNLENKEKRRPIDFVDSREFLNKLKSAEKRSK
uniref:26S proteasome non-ATPase regulatory subunit 10 n=1 Tax=Parascaris univalens TaxID=6257 RepID=A0A915B8B1_PARUN